MTYPEGVETPYGPAPSFNAYRAAMERHEERSPRELATPEPGQAVLDDIAAINAWHWVEDRDRQKAESDATKPD